MYILDTFTLHVASGSFKSFAASAPDLPFPLFLQRLLGYFSLILGGLWVSLVCTCDVSCTWVWKGVYCVGGGVDCAGVSRVHIRLCYYSAGCVCMLTPFMLADRGFFGSTGNGYG